MKIILIFLFTGATLAFGKPPEITLEPNKEDDRDYGEQLIKKFNALLTSEDVDFQNSGGRRDYTQTVILCYSKF